MVYDIEQQKRVMEALTLQYDHFSPTTGSGVFLEPPFSETGDSEQTGPEKPAGCGSGKTLSGDQTTAEVRG